MPKRHENGVDGSKQRGKRLPGKVTQPVPPSLTENHEGMGATSPGSTSHHNPDDNSQTPTPARRHVTDDDGLQEPCRRRQPAVDERQRARRQAPGAQRPPRHRQRGRRSEGRGRDDTAPVGG
jgi:hypothetical protein